VETDNLGDWDQHKLMVTSDLKQLKKDVSYLRTAQARDTLKISTQIATLAATAKHQGRLWGLMGGTAAGILVYLVETFVASGAI
jgi:hypothetical protein